ncbi:hypothetical protein BKA70DRAFT_1225904 [Coprinopsis sp. MPI-PUGE-AT-0042]|nr:hypothetical protein BKA70DRAFT_1225904 [Coprinopsis sp. MPI-PUGE-AT-0042]
MSLELDTNYPDFDFDKVFLEQGLIYRGTNEHNRWIYEDLSTTKRMRNNGQATDTYEFQGYNPDTDREKAAPQVAQYLTDDFDFLFMEGDTKDYSLTPEDFLEYSRAYESTSALVREDNSSAIDYTLGTQTHEDLPEPLYDPHNTVKEPELLREPLDATEFNSCVFINHVSTQMAKKWLSALIQSPERLLARRFCPSTLPKIDLNFPWRAPTPAPSVSRKREREEEGNIKVVGEINEMRESKRACIPSTSSFSELAMALEVAPPALGLRSPTGSAPPIVSPNLPAAPATAFLNVTNFVHLFA